MSDRARIKILRDALKIIAGGAHTGRWLDKTTMEMVDGAEGDDVPGAEWEPYTEQEQTVWIDATGRIARRALEKAKS